MNASGTYTEQIACGGKLKISRTSWEIEYYFQGPDLRYKGTFIRVSDTSVPAYITAFRENWAEYKRIKASMPGSGEFEKPGKCGMTIRVGGRFEGVCLRSYHMPIRSEGHLNSMISSYEYAQKRALAVQALLKNL